MHEIDKEQFGQFIGQLRREKGYTQKQLAELLFISDKAISKWERGLSIPDVSLLLPLADALDVTVTELLESRRLDAGQQPDIEQVEALVQKAIRFSGNDPEKQKRQRAKRILAFCLCWAVTLLLLLVSWLINGWENAFFFGLGTFVLLSFVFGIYFMFYAKERLPVYYDDNKINSFSDGPFRINIPGVTFNNSNWPHILKAARCWCCVSGVGIPLINLVLKTWFPQLLRSAYFTNGILLLFLLGLFVPIYVAAKKYE